MNNSIDNLLNQQLNNKNESKDTNFSSMLAKSIEIQKENLEILKEIKQNFVKSSDTEDELLEYKKDFLSMNIGSLNAIMRHAMSILEAIETDESVKQNLTESWLQGKIAITEDYMRTIHDFVKYVPSDDDNKEEKQDLDYASLWENIRKKREREGKNYKPAKPGDKDRPDPEAWKKAQK